MTVERPEAWYVFFWLLFVLAFVSLGSIVLYLVIKWAVIAALKAGR